MLCLRLACSLALLTGCVSGLTLASHPQTPHQKSGASPRDSEPVILHAASFQEILGEDVGDIRIFRVNNVEGRFDPIPAQVDEKILKVFNEGTEFEFSQLMHDVLLEDDGLLDANDEIAFMYRDAGVRAPEQLEWPAGAGALRYEIAIEDSEPGSSAAPRWVYLFVGAELETSPLSYVNWTGQQTGAITTERFELVFEGRWLLTEYRVFSPCGSGNDLIDRFKGRAAPLLQTREDEEAWSFNSSYLGGLVGPVRAIRYVRGASSGANTIHHDLVYESHWQRDIQLRVHPLDRAWVYFDWLPDSGVTFFTPDHLSGVPIDGSPDASVGDQFQPWQVVAGPGGGFAILWDMPESPLYTQKTLYYLDDASVDDQISTNPTYGDDDDSAYGDHGVVIQGIQESNTTGIPIRWKVFPTCIGDGDGQLGESLSQLQEYPLTTEPEPQWGTATLVRTLEISPVGEDLELSWQLLPEMEGYRVYTSNNADRPRGSWGLLAETTASTFVDEGQVLDPGPRYYSVVALTPGGGEAGW